MLERNSERNYSESLLPRQKLITTNGLAQAYYKLFLMSLYTSTAKVVKDKGFLQALHASHVL